MMRKTLSTALAVCSSLLLVTQPTLAQDRPPPIETTPAAPGGVGVQSPTETDQRAQGNDNAGGGAVEGRGRVRSRNRQPAPAAQDPAAALAAAQTLATAAGKSCQVVEARFIGRNNAGAEAYEATCASGAGLLVVGGEPTLAYNCLALAAAAPAEGAARCQSPRNLDAVATVQAYVQTAGLDCTVDEAAWRGQLTTGADRYEVSCAGSEGYFLDVAADGANVIDDIACLETSTAQPCQLTAKADQIAWLQGKYASGIPADCAPSDLRVAGVNTQAKFYEIACEGGAGYFIRTRLDTGAFDRAIPCAEALQIGDGCSLTDTSAAVAEAAARRASALAALVPSCQVGGERLIGRETAGDRREVVEFACAGKPVGVVAYIGADAADNEAFDCLTVSIRGIECGLTTAEQLKAAVQAQMDAGNMPCPVRQFMVHGRTDDQRGDFIEVKCEDDRSLFGQFPHERTRAANDVMICARARLLYGYECEL